MGESVSDDRERVRMTRNEREREWQVSGESERAVKVSVEVISMRYSRWVVSESDDSE